VASHVSRRDFLKLSALLPFLRFGLSDLAANDFSVSGGSDFPNILFIVFDTLSARNMSLYGYPRETTPNITRFAGRSVVYHTHYASANFTSPGTASLLTGSYPWSHRAFHMHSTVLDRFRDKNIFHLLNEPIHTIAYSHNLLVTSLLEQFKGDLDIFMPTRDLALNDPEYSDRIFPRDYNASFWGEGLTLRGGGSRPSSLFLSLVYKALLYVRKRALAEQYGQSFPKGLPNLNDIYYILEDAIDWIITNLASLPDPYLAYFHLLPPHEPYTPRRDFIGLFDDGYVPTPKPPHFASEGYSDEFLNQERRDYDAYIAYVDSEFGRLLESMERSGMLENTYVILTSDHGELFERGIRGHVTPALYQPLIRIPLIISIPGQEERRDIYANTSCVDVLPGVLSLLGKQAPDWCEGQLLPLQPNQQNLGQRSIYAVEAKTNPKHSPLRKGTLALIKGDFKLIHYLDRQGEAAYELYDLSKDPEEMEDLYAWQTSLAADLTQELAGKLNQVNQPYLR